MTREPMSKEEMIDILKGLVFGTFDKTTAIEREALNMAIKALEQEPVLGKIRAEITKLQTYKMFYGEDTVYVERDDVLEIIDRYKAKSEDKG